jgi:hypothetical protein
MMNRRRFALAVMVLVAAGCSRQDAETLGRIGDKLMQRAKQITPVKGDKDKLTVSLPGLEPGQDAGKVK